MTRSLLHKLLLAILLISGVNHTQAQIYPVAVAPMQLGPMSIYFDDFYSLLQPKIKTIITLNDLSVASRDVYLKIRLTGPGLTIMTTPGQKPLQPTTIYSSVPVDLSGVDLAEFFNFDHLSFSGISRSQLEVNSRLPEGAYTLNITVLDYESNTPLSSETPLYLQLALSDPPSIISPQMGGVVTTINPSNFTLNWMLSNSNSLVDIANVNYQIKLYEVTSNTAQPQNAIMNNQALLVWESDLLNQYIYNYGITDPPLEVGKKYVFTVQAIENYPRTQIKNNGVSVPVWFYYGYPEGGTIQIVDPEQGYQMKISDGGIFKWKRPNNALSGQLVSYDIRIVEVDSAQTPTDAISNNAPFDSHTTPSYSDITINYGLTNQKLNSMEKMQQYAWQVTGKTGSQTVAQSAVQTFIGPPYLDGFYASNFYVEIVSLDHFDSITGEISGRGRTKLKSGLNDYAEFNFSNLFLESAGNNLWVMAQGEIKDEIIFTPYTLTPNNHPTNGNIIFQPDSIWITTDLLRLGGKMRWQLPLIANSSYPPVFESKFNYLGLADGTYLLASPNPVLMDELETVNLLEPYGFQMQYNPSTELLVYESKYTVSLDGFVQLPGKVKDLDGSTLLMPFTNQPALLYMEESGQSPLPERIDFLGNSDFGLRGKNYVVDLSELQSPGDFTADSTWKGLYFKSVDIMIPEHGEESGQLSASEELEVELINMISDSTAAFVDYTGLNFVTKIPFQSAEVLYFNTFPSTETVLEINIAENEFINGELVGGIQIPFVDMTEVFPYTVPLNTYGFQIGNMDASLVDRDFIHNIEGAEAEKVEMHITRAVFKNKERIEFDLDAAWPEFQVSLGNIQNLTVWGNGNIGFEIPNGAASLNTQMVAKSGDYDMVVDYVGCGRDQNAYAFGLSAKMNMAENISGTSGAPVVNAYSIYIHPLLEGQFNGSLTDNILEGMPQAGAGSDSSASATTVANYNNLNQSLGSFADSLGVDLSGTEGDDNILPEDSYIKLGEILDLVEIFIPFIDESKQYKAQDYVTVGREIIEGDAYKALTSENPKAYIQDLLKDVLDGMIQKVNTPIQNATNAVNGKITTVMQTYVKNPIGNAIDTVLNAVFDEIEESTLGVIEDTVVQNLVKSIIQNVKLEIRNEIVLNIYGSIDTNITLPVTSFIQGALTDQITSFISEQIKYVGEAFIMDGVHADVNLSNIIGDAGTLFNDMKDTLVETFKRSGSIDNILKTGRSLVTDAYQNMDWNEVRQRILDHAAQEGVSTLLLAGLNQVFDNFESGILDGIMSNVSFDFTNLNEKIASGDLTGIVQFDPTNIEIKTSACDIRGQLKHTKDDPQYGDHWRASVAVAFKKPAKLKGVAVAALFITGKTTFSTTAITANPPSGNTPVDSSLYSYWFASLAVSGLQIPLSPIPLELTGIDGFAYHHMQKSSPTATPLPCRDNKLGLGVGFTFIDLASHGKLLKLDMQLEVIINNEDWAMEMYTLGDVAHRSGSSGSYSNPLATATGIMGYYSNIKTFKGQIDVVFHTQPLLCAGGTIKFNFDGMNNTWAISAGTQAQPIFAKLLCKDWLAITTFIEAQNEGLKAGLTLNIDIKAKSPWIDFGAVYARGSAEFWVYLDAYVDLQFQPDFRLNEAYVYLSMGADIGIDYKFSSDGDVHHFTLAGISLAGYGHYKAAPEGTLKGGLSGEVTIVGISCGLSINVDYDLGSRADNS